MHRACGSLHLFSLLENMTSMIVGSVQARLFYRASRSLKDKRQVLRSLKDRIRQQWNVSVAEVGSQDHRQLITLGIATVTTESAQAQSLLQEIINALGSHPVAELVEHEIEIEGR